MCIKNLINGKIEIKSVRFVSNKSLIESRHWSTKKIFLWKSVIFHPFKLPFDAEATKTFLKLIYFTRTGCNAVVHFFSASFFSSLLDRELSVQMWNGEENRVFFEQNSQKSWKKRSYRVSK